MANIIGSAQAGELTAAAPEDAIDAQPELPALPSRRRVLWRRYTRARTTGWTLVILIVVVWQLWSLVSYNPTISSPDKIAVTWYQQVLHGDLLSQLGVTLRTMGIGLVIAVPLGVGIGFLMGRSRPTWALLEPLVEITRLTPVTATLPIYVLFLGIGDSMEVAVFLTAGIFPMIINSYAGARSVSKVLTETAQTFRLSWWQTQREIALPSAIPYILVGMRQSLGLSLVLAVVIGMLAGNTGIGYYLLFAQQDFNIQQLMAGVISVALVGYLLNAIFLVLEHRATRWRRAQIAD